MKIKTIYVCDFCGTEHEKSGDAMKCEAKCLGLTIEQYEEYIALLKEEMTAFGAASIANNDKIRKRCDEAVQSVLDFQKKYNVIDNRHNW